MESGRKMHVSGTVVWVSDDDFLTRAYHAVLQRDLEPAARPGLLLELAEERLSRSDLIARMLASDEFARLRTLDAAALAGLAAARRREPLRSIAAAADCDERIIEIPWVLSRYRGEANVLDVGSAYASPSYVGALVRLGAERLVAVDPAEMSVASVESVTADARALPFPAESFDLVLCVSTLEHVGRDNRVYGLADERSTSGIGEALAELARVLTAAGRILLTVPCGDAEDHGWFVQLRPDDWRRIFADAGYNVGGEEIYGRAADGWSLSHVLPRGTAYGAHGLGASAVLCAELARP
jgi:SAM-dependent methyltransferase